MARIVKIVVIVCGVVGMANNLFAQARLVNGAGTLPQGDFAVSLNTGFSSPAPLAYSVGVDYGITDCVQLGATGSYFILTASGGLAAGVDFLCAQGSGHHLGLRMNPSYLYLNGIFAELKALILDPTIAYEYRWGTEQKTGLFVKGGTQHYYAKVRSDIFRTLFDTTDAGTTTWAHGVRFSAGLQHQFGNRFSMTGEGGVLARMRFTKAAPQARLGFTWAF